MIYFKIMTKDHKKELRRNNYYPAYNYSYVLTDKDKMPKYVSQIVKCLTLEEARQIAIEYIKNKKTISLDDLVIVEIEETEKVINSIQIK